jgi:hypothetical protein
LDVVQFAVSEELHRSSVDSLRDADWAGLTLRDVAHLLELDEVIGDG